MANTKSSRHTPKNQSLKSVIDAEYRARIKYLKKLGLYTPTLRPEEIGKTLKLTKARKARVRKVEEAYAPYLDDARYEVLRIAGNLAKQKTVRRQARQSDLTATLKAIFVPKKPGIKKVKLHKVRGRKRYVVVGTGVDKDTGAELTKELFPLGDTAIVASELREITRLAKREGKKIGDKTEMRIVSYGKYLWKRAYSSVDLFLHDLQAYHRNEWSRPDLLKDAGEFADFIEHVEVKVLPIMPWADAKVRLGLADPFEPTPPKGFRRVNHTGRN